ncbi:MAG: saccharopine dehydrogenase NADP-binding domain-containing protein [Bacteroidales bacterium]|nr:saccharopine dehydrogenase NADP-binding domain-containing protein [Bacteroidales bacterium]
MKTVLILGAGLSSNMLIWYYLQRAGQMDLHVRVGDISHATAAAKISGFENCSAFEFDVYNEMQRNHEISGADIVISMLPARMHPLMARTCINHSKNMVTASYASSEMLLLDREAREKGVLIMNECGVDPGIDHMSAMQMINRIRGKGLELVAFESSTGGLVAPGFENNPWQYKFTWNPRNVILAGRDGARFLHNGKFKYIPYHKLFSRIETINVPKLGKFEVYGNRDSLMYRNTYGLHNLETMFRGTIRRPGFCEAWDTFVQLGATDDSYIMEDTENMTCREFINSFMAYRIDIPVEEKLSNYLGIPMGSEMMERLKWLGIFSDEKIGIPGLTPAQVLQKILTEKWSLEPGDKDMILMQHQFDYMEEGKRKKIYSTLTYIGNDNYNTAMAATVGLPVAIISRMILEGRIKPKGVHLPVIKECYEPVLEELKQYNMNFVEETIDVPPDSESV